MVVIIGMYALSVEVELYMLSVSVCRASMYGGQLTGIRLYGCLSIMGGALYMYIPFVASVYVDSCVLSLCVICVSQF